MPVTRMREDKVIHRRIKKDQPSKKEKPCVGLVFFFSVHAQVPKMPSLKWKEECFLERGDPRLVISFRHAVPVIDNFFRGHE